MKKNEIYEIEITGTTDDGDGVGRVEGFAVFIPYALEGEVVETVIIKVLKNYAVGKIIKIKKKSQFRLEPRCEYFYKCGGCQFWNVDYSYELEYKQKKVENCLKRIGGIDTNILEIKGCEPQENYRNKAQFPVSTSGIGIYAKGTHDVIDIDNCIIQNEGCESIVECVREWMSEYNISAYDETIDRGVVRHIYIRVGDSEVIVCLVTRSKKLEFAEELANNLKELNVNVVGLVQNINSKKTNVILGDKMHIIWGRDFLYDTIGHVKFKISPLSFYQVNNKQTKVLYDLVGEFAGLKGDEIVWDMYCGIGTIGQYLAKLAKKIVGVEAVEDAIRDAKENANLNNIENTDYFCGLAENIAPSLVEKGLKPDVVILDPPRKGCAETLLKTVSDTGVKKIIYVSCKPSTLARDLKYLEQEGYKTIKVQPVDMFPRTSHVETVVLMSRVDK